jgi:hypothetical protein
VESNFRKRVLLKSPTGTLAAALFARSALLHSLHTAWLPVVVEMAQSIVDMIMVQKERHQASLLVSTISSLGVAYFKRRGLVKKVCWGFVGMLAKSLQGDEPPMAAGPLSGSRRRPYLIHSLGIGPEGTNILNRAVRPFGLYQPFVAVTKRNKEYWPLHNHSVLRHA